MDENGKALIRDLIKGGLGRNEIKEEMVNAGYDYSDIEKELDFAYLISGVGAQDSANLYATQNIAPPPSVAVSPTASAAQKPAAAKKSYTITIVVFLIIALGAGFYAYNAGMFGAQNISAAGGNGRAPNQSQKAETGLLDKITNLGKSKALISEEELKKLNETCAQKARVYREKYEVWWKSLKGKLSTMSDDLSALGRDATTCYANYSIMAGDYSLCKNAVCNYSFCSAALSESRCLARIPSLNGDASACDKTDDKTECYINAAKYHSDVSYCDKIPATSVLRMTCISNLVTKDNYAKLCPMMIPPNAGNVISTSAAMIYGECFANIAQETKNPAVCDEARGWDYVCYARLAALTQDRNLCDKTYTLKDQCLKSVGTAS